MTRIDEEWFRTLDRFSKVGSRHHVVPKFLLQKWADSNERVWAKSKHDRIEGVRNIRDLAITDFYTFLADDDHLDARMEEVLSVVEEHAAAVLRRMNNPLATQIVLTAPEFGDLVDFVAFQMTRSPRRRREYELMADWSGKTMAAGTLAAKVSEDELRKLEFVPHQNEHIGYMQETTEPLAQELYGRPVALVTIDRPLFLIGDEPVIVNIVGDHVQHLPECSMTEEQFQHKLKRAAKKKGRRRREVRRTLHVYPTQPRGITKAVEIVMPISPRTLLVLGAAAEWDGVVVRDTVCGAEADELAAEINYRIAEYSLDVIVGRIDDLAFQACAIPEPTPILNICGATGAAKDVVASVPARLRPRRLDRRSGRSGGENVVGASGSQ
jgi:hypothetical protein